MSECDREASKTRRPWPTGGLLRHGNNNNNNRKIYANQFFLLLMVLQPIFRRWVFGTIMFHEIGVSNLKTNPQPGGLWFYIEV